MCDPVSQNASNLQDQKIGSNAAQAAASAQVDRWFRASARAQNKAIDLIQGEDHGAITVERRLVSSKTKQYEMLDLARLEGCVAVETTPGCDSLLKSLTIWILTLPLETLTQMAGHLQNLKEMDESCQPPVGCGCAEREDEVFAPGQKFGVPTPKDPRQHSLRPSTPDEERGLNG